MSADPITVSDAMLNALRRTRPWVTFLSILGFIFAAFCLLGGLWMFMAFGLFRALPVKQPMPPIFGPTLFFGVGALEIVMAVFMYLLPCVILFRYGSAIGRIVPGNEQAMVEEALGRQKSFWKYMGILMIVLIILYVVMLISMFAVIGTLAAHAAHGTSV